MAELKQLTKLSEKICSDPAQHVNSLNQLIPGLLTLIESKVDAPTRERVLSLVISLAESLAGSLLEFSDLLSILQSPGPCTSTVAQFITERILVLLEAIVAAD